MVWRMIGKVTWFRGIKDICKCRKRGYVKSRLNISLVPTARMKTHHSLLQEEVKRTETSYLTGRKESAPIGMGWGKKITLLTSHFLTLINNVSNIPFSQHKSSMFHMKPHGPRAKMFDVRSSEKILLWELEDEKNSRFKHFFNKSYILVKHVI